MHRKKQNEFLALLEEFPLQLQKASELVKAVLPFPYEGMPISSIVFAGMGGSAIAGDLILGYGFDQLQMPFLIHRGYSLPSFVNEITLVIVSSYSGNTEETLHAFKRAEENHAKILVITSGGKLGELAIQKKYPVILLPQNYPPRQTLGYTFFSLIHLFRRLGWITLEEKDIEEAIKVAELIQEKQHPKQGGKKHISLEIAQSFHKKIPVIYSACPWLAPVARRIRNQIHENAKILAFSNELPEMNHNEIVGWEMEPSLLDHMAVCFIRDNDEPEHMKRRVEFTHQLIQKHCPMVAELYPEGSSRLAKMISLIALGDWISYYLAVLNDRDPFEIKYIDMLKNYLKTQ